MDRIRRFIRENALSLAMFALFLAFLVGQSFCGERAYNSDRADHAQPPASYFDYLKSGHFLEAVFENWESEFLQMGLYVLFSAFLKQKGSPESKTDGEGKESAGRSGDPRAPWPARRGGWALKVYENSLTCALLLMFFLSFYLHARTGRRKWNEEEVLHGGRALATAEYLGTANFWFESFQNWQSEFFSLGLLMVLSIFLRQKGSSQSKPLAAPHSETGK